MSEADRRRWDERYRAAGTPAPAGAPRPLLAWAVGQITAPVAPGAPGRRRALDLACGAGREAAWLAGAGFAVDAVDISAVALGQAAGVLRGFAGPPGPVRLLAADLDAGLPDAVRDQRYELVWAGHFRAPVVEEAVAGDDGVLVGGGVLATTRLSVVGRSPADGGGVGPDPSFLATPGELLTLATRHGLEVLRHEEGDGVAALVARRPLAASAR